MDDKTMDAVPTTSASEMRAAGWLSRAEADAAIAAACAEIREQAAQRCIAEETIWRKTADDVMTNDYPGNDSVALKAHNKQAGLVRADECRSMARNIRSLPIPHADALARAKASVAAFKAEVREYLEGLNVKIVGFESADGTSALLAGFDSLPADDSALARREAEARLEEAKWWHKLVCSGDGTESVEFPSDCCQRIVALTAEAEGKSLT